MADTVPAGVWRKLAGCVVACCMLSGCWQGAGAARVASPLTTARRATPMVTAVNLSSQRLQNVPMTFGQPFRAGDVPKGDTVTAYLGGHRLPTQVDVKATNPNGSLRHAVLTVELPRLGSHAHESLELRATPQTPPASGAVTLANLLATGFDASITLTIDGQPWHLDARTLLQRAQQDSSCKPYGKACASWLSGPLVSEWIVGGPLKNASGKPHPHLAAYFAVRAYGPAPVRSARVDVIVDNDWVYVPGPRNFTYDARIDVGGKQVYAIQHLTHYVHARWHETFWWGAPDPVYAKLDSAYLQASLAVPRYGARPASARFLDKQIQECAPMQHCNQTRHMVATGAQAAIGPLPQWTTVYVIDPTYRAYRWMLANSDALGSYDVHYRDEKTGQPVSLTTHPCMTLVTRVGRCPVAPHGNDTFPHCADKGSCKSPLEPNSSHHPSPAYVAYLVTGDWYYLTEMKDWANWLMFKQNPAYRHYAQGLIVDTQVRGQAWSLRTLGYAAYILPDHDPLKRYFNQAVENNLRWYNQKYTDNPSANQLHVLVNGYALAYPNHRQSHTGVAVWQQSFFTWAVGNLKDLGFAGAGKLLDWVGAFQVNLMTDPGYCWTQASAYELQVRDTRASPLYTSLAQAYAATFPQLRGVACNSNAMLAIINKHSHYKYARGAMYGYPYSPVGYPANFQIGLAAVVNSGLPKAAEAWEKFSRRTTKPNYAERPQFAVIPRPLARPVRARP